MGEHHENTSPTNHTNGNGNRLGKTGGAFGGPNSTGSAAATIHQVVLHGPFGGPNTTGNGSHQEEHPVDQQLGHSEHAVQEKEMINEDEDAKEKIPTPGSHTTTEDSGKGTGSEEAQEKEMTSDTKVDTGNEQGPKEMIPALEQGPKEMIMPAPGPHATTTDACQGSGHTGDQEEKSMKDKVSGKPQEAAAPAING